MKKHIIGFIRRGLLSAWGGPAVLAIVYFFLGKADGISALTPSEVSVSVLSTLLLAFVAGGLTELYTVERLPLSAAILIHGGVLYLDYLIIYLLNGWLKGGTTAVIVFTAAFFVGYAIVWLCIYCAGKRDTKRMNTQLKKE